MPNNQNSNNDYVSTAMNTNSIQLYMLAPVFLAETLMTIVAKKDTDNTWWRALRLIKPLTPAEADILKQHHPKASEYIALINNVGLGLNLTTATAMTGRATVLQFTKGNENVANADIIASWCTSVTGLVSPLARIGSTIASRALLYRIPANQRAVHGIQDHTPTNIQIIETPPVTLTNRQTFNNLINGNNVNMRLSVNSDTSRIIETTHI